MRFPYRNSYATGVQFFSNRRIIAGNTFGSDDATRPHPQVFSHIFVLIKSVYYQFVWMDIIIVRADESYFFNTSPTISFMMANTFWPR
jgi:hypothetical protein